MAQWHNVSSGTTNTDSTQMKDFLSSLVSGAQQTETTLGKFVSNRGKLLSLLLSPNRLINEFVAVCQNTAYIQSDISENSICPGHFQERQIKKASNPSMT